MKNDSIKLGQLIEGEAQRDAIHIAIAPVTAFRSLSPGEPVGLTENGEADNLTAEPIGIVDPFLKARVPRGERFYIVLFPGTITGLRHEWTHPAFDAPPKVKPELTQEEKSRAWLQEVASRCGVSYDRMIGAVDADDYINMGENEGYKNVEEIGGDDFAKHCSIVLGREIKSAYPFSCSC